MGSFPSFRTTSHQYDWCFSRPAEPSSYWHQGVRKNFNFFILKPCYGIFINKLPVQLQPLLIFSTLPRYTLLMFLCIKVGDWFVWQAQRYSLVLFFISGCVPILGIDQQGGTLTLQKCFSTVFFQRLTANLLFKWWRVYKSTFWNWPGDTRSKDFSVNDFTHARKDKIPLD